ncbi:hypothetical protein [Sphingobacterium hungaricum]|uniref:Uncharacterized protein n=1 Tax=Sphingobacterium hungaricum TaxID=2082723 RepID=A0A928YS29_9SPHI|nr:hypothetical protein [Sphingobacterium hungaricum]MBE8715302.1 hypothetical protein [Sphingobacterium hungaricum]
MKKNNFYIVAFAFIALFTSCSKDDPTPEIDQEEVSTATLTFTEVEGELHNDHYHYNPITDAEVEVVEFGADGLPPAGVHLHLEVGKTYKVALVAKDFTGRETQQTFVERHDIHQAFLLGAPADALEYVYADRDAENKKVSVGVTGYITVLKASNTFVFRYVMRHLNEGVKANITADDWNNANYTQFTGANDLDLKVELHLVEEDEHGH